jgi:O-antigen ligase
MAGRRPSAPVLPARPLSAAVQAALALCLAGTIAAMLVLARRTKLSLVAATVAERCRLPLAQAAVAAGILAVMWVALGEVRAEDGWLGLIVAAILVLVLAGRPELAPAAGVLAAPFHSKVAVPLGPVNIGILEAAIACAFGGWAIAWTGVGRRSRLGLVDWLAVALVVWGGIAVVWSDFQWEALREWRVVLLEPALVFLMLRGSTSRARSAEIALDALVAGATLAALWGLASLGGAILGSEGAGVVRAEGVLRIAGPYGSPNNLALFAGRAVSVAAATALFAISSRRRRIHAAQLIVLLLAIGATFSRGALFIGLPVALAALVTIAVATRGTTFRALRRAAAVAAVGVLAFLAAFARTDRIAGAFSPAPGGTLHLRLRLWESALRMGLDHPILGVGPDNFLGHYRDTYVQRDAVQERFLNHPHNLVLDTWLRLGIAGAIAVGVVAVRTVIAGVRGLGQEGRPRALGAAALVGLAYTVAHGLIDNFLFVPDLAVAWWILVASALAAEEARVVTPTDGG